MKKVLLTLVFVSIFAAGCEKKNANEVVCTGKTEEGGVSYSMKVIGTLENDKITKANIEMDFPDKETAQKYCGILALAKSFGDDESAFDYTCDGKTVKIDSLDAMSNDSDGEYIGLTREQFIEKMSSDENVTCK